jgi:hypothetical protein
MAKGKFDPKKVEKVMELREKGLSFRKIMREMKKKDVKTIYRWYAYGQRDRQAVGQGT